MGWDAIDEVLFIALARICFQRLDDTFTDKSHPKLVE